MLDPSSYYHQDLKRTYRHLVVGKRSKIITKPVRLKETYDYLVLENTLSETDDIQEFLSSLHQYLSEDSRVIIVSYNHLWEPALKLASLMGWRRDLPHQNWLSLADIDNFLDLSGFETIYSFQRFLFPFYTPYISSFFNRYLAHLPLINKLCLSQFTVCRLKTTKAKDYSVSIIIPARNESGNIKRALDTMPILSPRQEVIFIEGHSRDDTWKQIQLQKQRTDLGFRVRAYQQTGIGKGDAVRLGFSKAKHSLLMILDADLTVDPVELPKFYRPIASGQAEYVHGSRLVYPMEQEAMRYLNKLGNKFFGLAFSYLLGQRIKDTLCGTKVIRKKHYLKIAQDRSYFGDFDPFGDFDLIFGAVRLGLKIKEVPITYKQRSYGTTNISRFKHGLLLLRMTLFAFFKFKAY